MIAIENLHKSFGFGEVLKGVSLQIPSGSFLVIVGASGSGKTTLLNLIGGLEKPSKGKILIDGVDIASLKGEALGEFRNRKIGYIYQNFYLEDALSALVNVSLPGIILSEKPAIRKAKAEALLTRFGINDPNKAVRSFSGGERQRIAIARALYNDPPLLLADEPTGNLDKENGDEAIALLQKLSEEGKTVIMVTHNPAYETKGTGLVRIRDGELQKMSNCTI
jgi:putative ABC transport system ATP-binding protein